MAGGVAVDAANNVWVCDNNNSRIQEFDTSGTFLSKFGSFGGGNGQFNGLTDVAFDASGNLWDTEYWNQRIEKFTTAGAYLTQFGTHGTGPGQFGGPEGMSIDQSGNIWIADKVNNTIVELATVPEPSTFALAALGAVGLLYSRRRFS